LLCSGSAVTALVAYVLQVQNVNIAVAVKKDTRTAAQFTRLIGNLQSQVSVPRYFLQLTGSLNFPLPTRSEKLT